MSELTPSPAPHAGSHRSRRSGLLWVSGALAASILVLGTNGTLSAWTSAVLLNDTNTVKTTTAVILRETDGSATCTSSDEPTGTNTFTCTTVNKYGGVATPLAPGGSQVVNVTFTNVGSANAATFALAPGTCSQTPVAGAGSPGAANVCTSGDLTVAVSCSPGATYSAGTAWTDLVYTAAAPPTGTKSHALSAGDLNAAATWTCRFTVALSASASVLAQNITVSQPLTWTLTQV